MLTKSYSIALPLLGAFLFAGCSASTAPPSDLPDLLFSNFEQAQGVLGKPKIDDSIKNKAMNRRNVRWSQENEWLLEITYRTNRDQMPTNLIFGGLTSKSATDKQTFLKKFNLNEDDTRYKIQWFPSDFDRSKIDSVMLERPDAYTD